jgi:predicted metalloprotease with PDZ domain
VLDFFGEVHPPLRVRIAEAVEHPGGLSTPDQLRALGFEVTIKAEFCLGLVFMNEVSPSIYGVLDDGAAGAAGLAPGDELVAIDGFAFSTAALLWAGARSDPVELTVQRGHRRLTFTVTPNARDRIGSLRWVGTAAQRARICAWLGQEQVDLVNGKLVDLAFYENFHGVEVVV